MNAARLMGKFVARCPFAVLTQLAIRGLAREDFDAVFEEHRSRQYEKQVLFSAVAVADVTLGMADNFNQAYAKHKQELGVSLGSFYDKINHVELPVSEALVPLSAERAVQLQDELGFVRREVLRGYRVLSIDGNHLPESDKRLGPLRQAVDAPLAHAQESTVHDRIVADLAANDLLIGDRHQCVLGVLRDIDKAKAFFVLRQHGRFQGCWSVDGRKSGPRRGVWSTNRKSARARATMLRRCGESRSN